MNIEVTPNMLPSVDLLISFVDRYISLAPAETDRVSEIMSDYSNNPVLGSIDEDIFQKFCMEEGYVFLNLYPNMSRSQYTKNDTFIYAGPVQSDVWVQLQKYCRRTPDRIGYLLPEDMPGLNDAVIILRGPSDSDDDMLTAAAFIRMVDGVRHRVYCVPARSKLSHAVVANATAGAPRELCQMVTIDLSTIKKKENEDPQIV